MQLRLRSRRSWQSLFEGWPTYNGRQSGSTHRRRLQKRFHVFSLLRLRDGEFPCHPHAVRYIVTYVFCVLLGYLLCLVHTIDTDKTRLSCLVRIGGVNRIGDKTRQFSVVLNIFDTEQLQIGNWVETRQSSVYAAFRDKTKLSCFVANSVYTADTDKTRQDSFVLSVSAVWTSYYITANRAASNILRHKFCSRNLALLLGLQINRS